MASNRNGKSNGSEVSDNESYQAPEARYFKSKEQFDQAVGQDFIQYVNQGTLRSDSYLVGLSHGQSPAGAYSYIIDHFNEVKNPRQLRFTFVNTPLVRQRGLHGVVDAKVFLTRLIREGFIRKEQIIGRTSKRESPELYVSEFNHELQGFLTAENKTGLDYVFLASDPTGRVAGIARHSEAFLSKDIAVVVDDRNEKELTATPYFLKQSKRVAFLATKADKRRPLAWLYYRWSLEDESPSFLRFMENVKKRMTVFIDDKALTWPQVTLKRETPYGETVIRIDTAKPFNEKAKRKLPVVLLVHGFLGLNSYDALLTAIPSHKYIAAAMHYGSVPTDLPPKDYSKHVEKNINHVVRYFGELGHPVYLFDHSMGNIYFLMLDRDWDEMDGVRNYLCGRIGANPFFGEEARHAMLGFLDNVILPSGQGIVARALFAAARSLVPLDSKVGVRNRGIALADWLISKDSDFRDRVWKAAKERIMHLMVNMGSLPHVNRIPLEQALSRLPAKLFAIQTHSALIDSKAFDRQTGLLNMTKHDIPVLILKSERDGVAKYVHRIYQGEEVKVVDVTDHDERDAFREHLFHMIQPVRTANIIDSFITEAELKRDVPQALMV
ncbi:MAG: 6-phosphogluconolactonase [Flavobacteriales bacterium]|nr:6-phosphogluconolactonase [Flavobacteriales bacterium]